MANVLSLALKINADSTGLTSGLGKAERAFLTLQGQAERVTSIFDEFAGSSEAAARAQEQTAAALNELLAGVQRGEVSAAEFARQFAAIGVAAREEADALREAARITEANLTPLERFTRAQARLKVQLDAGRISQETYTRAVEGAARSLNAAERAAAGLASQQRQIEGSAKNTTLQFNELSGVFSVLPGPLGNIAGRLSGLSSASQGLGRIFSGGLSQGISALAGSFTALLNPVTLAVGGILAFAEAARRIAAGLISLENRVEALGNQAFQLGVSFEFVQVLDESARRSGTSVDALRGATTRLQQQLVEAGNGSATAAAAIEGLGVSIEELQSLDADGQFRAIAEAITQIPDPAERTAAATRLFGEAGVQLLPFFRNLEKAADDLERYGRALDDIDKRRIDEFGSAVDSLGVATQGLGNALLLPFTGLGEGIATALAEITAGLTAFLDPIGRFLQPAFDNLGRAFALIGRQIGNIGRLIGAVLSPFADAVQAVYTALEPLIDGFYSLLAAVSDIGVEVAEFFSAFNPLPFIAELFADIVGSVREFGETVYENFQPVFDALDFLRRTVERVFRIIREVFSRLVTFFRETIGAIIERIRRLITIFLEYTGIGRGIEVVNQVIYDSFASLFNGVSSFLSTIGGWLDDALTFVEDILDIRDEIEEPIVPTINGVELTGELAELQASVAEFGNAGVEAFLAYKEQLDEIAELVAEGEYDGDAQQRAVALATAEFERQRDVLKEQADAQEAAAEAARRAADEQQRLVDQNIAAVDRLLDRASGIPQVERDLNLVQGEINRVEAAQAAARAEGLTEQANALAARLAELDQLQSSLQDQAEAAAQGFSQGFESAFERVDRGINSLINKASDFGNAGAEAALALQNGIEAAQQQVRDGILTREAFESEVERQKQLFEDRIDDLRALEEINNRIAEGEGKIRDRQFEIELARAEELSRVRTGSVEVADLREGGISAFFDTLQEDPAIAEARKQTRELEAMRRELQKLQAEKVEILAGTG